MRHLPRIALLGIATLAAAAGLAAPAHGAASTVPSSVVPATAPHTVAPVDGFLHAYHISGIYVSGVSSGGYMATQLQVAYSRKVKGAAIFAAGPYYCAQNNVNQALYACGEDIWPDYLPTLEADASLWAGYGWIDPTSNIASQKVYVYHGSNDTTVAGSLTSDLVSFNQHFGASTQYVTSSSGHAWVTPYGPGACGVTASPFLNNCGSDPEKSFLTKLFGSVNAANTGTLTGTLTRFSQSAYAIGGSAAALSMGAKGFAYVPSSCASGATCRLMIALHGCAQSYDDVGTAFVDDANLNQYADTNTMIVLYPQATASAVNPYGCWDWWGYLGYSNYPIHGGLQIETIMNEAHALGG
jgi:hypothetical protein